MDPTVAKEKRSLRSKEYRRYHKDILGITDWKSKYKNKEELRKITHEK